MKGNETMENKYLWNDGWSFHRADADAEYAPALLAGWDFDPVDLPHDWLIYDSRRLYEDGTGWYRKEFTWERDESKRAFLTFEGVYMDSSVYLNGVKAFEWKNGYSTFTLEVTDYLKRGTNEIVVRVCFKSPNSRWYSGAGIYRDVWLTVTERTYLPENGIYISTEKQGEKFLLRLDTEIEGDRAGEGTVTFRLFDWGGRAVSWKSVPSEGSVQKYLISRPRLWDVEDPTLYTLRAELWLDGVKIQERQERFGFRYTEFDPEKGFFLNGRKLKLNGVCEHHDLGALGAVFNRCAMKRKFRILKEMGVNAVRGAHNMMAPGFVSLADEMGILVLSEAFDMWERPKGKYDYARFFKAYCERDVESWVRRDRNHPSVIMWSIGNEIYDTHADERGQEITAYLKELVERFDPEKNARVTLCSNYMPWENAQKCADIVKIAGYNYSEKYYEAHHEAHPDWVIYGSETSSIVQSRGVYHFPLKAGILSEDDEQCSSLGNSPTSWGARSLEECVTKDRDMEFSMGQFLWTGFDYIGEPTPYHTKNSYFGQIDTAGFPKDSFYVWQSAWTDYKRRPMVHVFPHWDFNEGQLIDVRVCSNAPYVELFLNGKSLGKQELSHGPAGGKHIIADYQVPYENGILAANAYDEFGVFLGSDVRHSFGDSRKIVVIPERTEAVADGRDLIFAEIGTVDENGNPVENACDRVEVRVSGAGRLIGLDNGDSTDFDSYKGVSRRLFNGKLLAVIQTNTEPGEIRIAVSGKGLKEGRALCRGVSPKKEPGRTGAGAAGQKRSERSVGITALEKNQEREVVLGSREEIPVRNIKLTAPYGQLFTKENDTLTAKAQILPENASYSDLSFKAVNDKGVPVHFVELTQEGNHVVMKALGDGAFRLYAMSRSGGDKVRIMSQLEFRIEGIGEASLDPYGFISGGQYTSVIGEAGNGNEKGVATARDGETVVSFGGIDFGSVGSDEITIPIFALSSEEYPIQIWEGIPGREGSALAADVVYRKPSKWNVYQPETYRLNRRLKGVTTVSFLVRQKIHIKGFSFTRYEKAWMSLGALEADDIYGDSFVRGESAVEEIGNNVSLVFTDMDFGERRTKGIAICGRAPKGSNTIHVRFFDGQEEQKQIVEFPACGEYQEYSFPLEPIGGKWEVNFVFLPGSCFDFRYFRFF